MSNQPRVKRPYLRAEERREVLLAVASAIVDRDGLASLTMVGVAEAAGISRQLVYRHFVDHNRLLEALLRSRFAAMEESFEQQAASAVMDTAGFIESRVRAAMTMPAADHRLIRSIFGDLGSQRPDMAQTVSTLRQSLIDRYAVLVRRKDGPAEVSRARIWAAVNALFGLWELYDEGLLELDDAVGVFVELTS